MTRATALIASLLLIGACSSGSDTSAPAETSAPATTTTEAPADDTTTTAAETTTSVADTTSPFEHTLFDENPYTLVVPDAAASGEPLPLVILLHGYGANKEIQLGYFGLEPLAKDRGFLLAVPDGDTNALSQQYWNATDACCSGGDGSGEPDHVAMLRALIGDVSQSHAVDPDRVYFIGHSNGGFMSYRMACDASDLVAAVVSLAGATWADPEKCSPESAVSVLQIHGTADETILYDGGDILGSAYPSAADTVRQWAGLNSCGEPTDPIVNDDNTLDLEATIDAADTAVYGVPGCPDGVDVELWTINGGSHIPSFTPDFAAGAIDFLLAHTKVRP